MANTTTTSNWKTSLAQIVLSIGTSYLMAKLQNKETGWVSGGYRDALIGNLATTAMETVAEQVTPAATTGTAAQ